MASYSNKEIVLRVLWAIIEPVFFRMSPRLFYRWRNFVLRVMGASIGHNVQIYPSARITFPWLLTVGDGSVISWGVRIYNLGRITIGRNTVVSQYSHLCGGSHDYLSREFTLQRTGLTIGNNVWIASDVFIGPAVTVGDGALIAARAVVTHDVQQRKLVGGHPARVLKHLERNARW